jgi:integrase
MKIPAGEVSKRTWVYQGKKHSGYGYSLTVIEDDGARRRYRKQFATRAEAQTALDAKREELRNAKPKADVAAITLGQALERLLELKSRKRALREYEWIAEHLKTALGAETPLASITTDRIVAYKAERLAAVRKVGKGDKAEERRLSAAAINRPLAILRHLLRQAKRWKLVAEVPEIDMEKEPQGRLRWLEPGEAQQLLAACQKSRNPALADLVEFVLFTGVRKGEALGLTWDRVDRARGVIRLEVTKSGHRREVPLSANADAVLARRWSEGAAGYVFGTKNWYAFQTAWLAALRRAKVENFRFHDLRHTFASWLVQRGRSLKEIQDALGHRTMAMTLRYSHLAPEHLRAAVAVLDDVLPARAEVGQKLQRVTEAPQTISA